MLRWLAQTVLLAFPLVRPTSACNGANGFCDLPFTKYTFPGSHNSNAFDLDIPDIIWDEIPGVDTNNALRCFFENHDMNLLEQLNFGIRAFMVDLCVRPENPDIFTNCHAGAYGGDFANDFDRMKEWLTVNQRELIVVSPDNMHRGSETMWRRFMSDKFGGPCLELGETTDVSSWSRRSEASCALVVGRPNDNITMGELVNNNLRMVFWPTTWRHIFFTTYDEEVQPGATSQSLLDDFMLYANGMKPIRPNEMFLFQVFGSAKMPNLQAVQRCSDPLCKAAAVAQLKEDLELDCVKSMSSKYNRDLLQDDTTPHQFFSSEECPEYACGCLGYRSPLEVAHQKLLQNGHTIQAVFADYPEVGGKTHIGHLAMRMNEANLRHLRGEKEPGAGWWSCNWSQVVAIGAPILVLSFCCLYVTLAMLYPKRYGVCIRKQWEAYQRRREAAEQGRERGREEARAYLSQERWGANGAPGQPNPALPSNVAMSMPQQIPPTVVAPSAGYPQNGYYYPQNQFQKFAETE